MREIQRTDHEDSVLNIAEKALPLHMSELSNEAIARHLDLYGKTVAVMSNI
jgi:hypothetical protein